MKKLTLSLSLLALLLCAAACKKKPDPGYSTFKLDQAFELKMGASAKQADGDLKLTFATVDEDSRCPEGVNCIQAGQVRVSVAASAGSEAKTLSFTREGKQAGNVTQAFAGYKIHLNDVSPYPKQGKKTGKEDYVLKLAVRK